ncbi:MAG TPA: hypothetical protein VEQ87_22945 [Burkholderiales bacterium]|nr:hypothetical protein [Burkholderiales bacterium]
MLFKWSIEQVRSQGAAAANEPWLAFSPRQEVTITRLGEYTKVVLTKFDADALPAPQQAWA